MSKTSISWTQMTWNPVTGCSKVSPGCDHCYAEALSRRFGRPVVNGEKAFLSWDGVNAAHNVVLHHERLVEPLRVRKPSMFFVCSMGDLFHELVPWSFIGEVFETMAVCPQHIFQVLTKRPGRMAYWAKKRAEIGEGFRRPWSWPANVWAGTSVESAKYLPRLTVLARVPARVRFVSAEPLLSPLDLRPWLVPLSGTVGPGGFVLDGPTVLSWCIAGGESGPGHRVADPAWFRDLRDQCQAAGVPFFMKQDSGPRPGMQGRIPDDVWACKEMPQGGR